MPQTFFSHIQFLCTVSVVLCAVCCVCVCVCCRIWRLRILVARIRLSWRPTMGRYQEVIGVLWEQGEEEEEEGGPKENNRLESWTLTHVCAQQKHPMRTSTG